MLFRNIEPSVTKQTDNFKSSTFEQNIKSKLELKILIQQLTKLKNCAIIVVR